MTQAALAAHVGVSQQQIVKYEKGIGRIPAEKLSSLAEWLQIDPGALFYPLAVVEGAAFGGFAESGAPYQSDATVDRDTAQLLRDFQRIDTDAARQAVLDLVSALARKGDVAPSRGRKRR